MTEYRPRRAARVLLLDSAGRVLLFRGCDPGRPDFWYWFSAGGGLEPGEDPATGAARELWEETGLRVAPADLGEPVWQEIADFPFDGVWYRQDQVFYVHRVESWEIDTSGFDDIERDTIDGHRWWSAAELRNTTERYYPRELPDLLGDLVGTP